MFLICPACVSFSQSKVVDAGDESVELEVCSGCRGIWLDGGLMGVLEKGRIENYGLNKLPGGLKEAVHPLGARFCPRCEKPLDVIQYRGIFLEKCRGCQGLWFERNRLSAVLDCRKYGRQLSPGQLKLLNAGEDFLF